MSVASNTRSQRAKGVDPPAMSDSETVETSMGDSLTHENDETDDTGVT